jgi:peptide/nickel transport system substrate-binding protein
MGPVRAGRVVCAMILSLLAVSPSALGQKRGGTLVIASPDSPASMSIMEEATVFAVGPMAGVFNSLVMFDQAAPHNSLETVVPDLATSWTWSADGLALTFALRQGVRWHDGKPFTANDVLCTFALLMETCTDKLRINPRKATFNNIARLSANGDSEVTFHLKRPQPALLMLLAPHATPIYPCHVPARDIRARPIGTGPFKFVEYQANQYIRVVRNPDYWKPDRPYLDGIEYRIIADPATASLAFVAGKVDMTFPQNTTVAITKNIQAQAPGAICEMTPAGGVNRTLIINRDHPPFDNAELRRAMALSIDRQAFIDVISEGQGDIGGVMQPPPGGLWGLPREMLQELPGYNPDVARNREEGRAIMRRLGYGPENRLNIKLLTRNLSFYRAPAVMLIDQFREVFIEAELDAIETTQFFPRLARKEFNVGLNLQTSGPDPDQALPLFYGCGSNLNWDNYCSKDVDALIERQSLEADRQKRQALVWAVERKLAEDVARPIIFYTRSGSCWHPYVKNVNLMQNSLFNGHRREDIWLDR